jgi:hypothetical protein
MSQAHILPVVLYVWSRPDKLGRVFEKVKEAKPTHLFLVSDGAINNSKDQWELIYQSRKIVDDINWDCEVHKIYCEENNGLFKMFKKMSDYVFSKVDRYIFLEDDVVPSVSFFKYCQVLLEEYKDDLRINMICGMNHLGLYKQPKSDYFFSRGVASIWGFATWKRTYEKFYDFKFTRDKYIFDNIINNSREFKSFNRNLYGYKENERYEGDLAGPEFFLGLSAFTQNQLSIIPTKNMICNIGYGGGGRNFNNKKLLTKKIARLFDMKTYEYNFPLKHPECVIEDNVYKDMVLYSLGRKTVLFEFIESFLRHLIFEKLPKLYSKVKS